MTKESTGKVLEGILTDAERAGEIAKGDFTNFADEDLTEAERALLEAAAGDLYDADVSGFAVFAKYDGVDGESRSLRSFDFGVYPKVEIVAHYVEGFVKF